MEAKLIGIRITEARKKTGLSQAQLAEQLFISPQAVGKWERGESFPDILTFNRLAIIFGVDLNYFSEDFTSLSQSNAELDKTEVVKPLWNMSQGNWKDADFSGLKNLREKFSSSNLQNCKFIDSDLSHLILNGNNVLNCDFSRTDFTQSKLQRSNFEKNNFSHALLKTAEFTGSNISSCDFSHADLSECTIKKSGFEKNILENTTWKNTAFTDSHLGNLVFNGRIEDCSFDNCSMRNVRFENVTLISTFFKCRSLKKVSFVNSKADRLTYEFLKQGKADLTGLDCI